MRDRSAESELPVLWCDGGSRGNPGPSAIGFVLIDEGVVLAEGAHPIGVATAALAEYRAVLAGLTAALDARVDSLEVRTDSRLLVAHMRGEAPVRSEPIALLADEIRSLAPGSRCCSTAGCRRPRTARRTAWRSWPCDWRDAGARTGTLSPRRRKVRDPPAGGAPQRGRTPTTAGRASLCASS